MKCSSNYLSEDGPKMVFALWKDGDGTKHFFKKGDVTYYVNGASKTVTGASGAAKDEDGLGLYVVPVADTTLSKKYPYKIVNKSGSMNMYFDKAGNLGMIADANQREDGKNSTNKKNRIEIIYERAMGESCDYGDWEFIWDNAKYLFDLISDTDWFNGDFLGYRDEYLQ